nr:unnamed protein product [Callosobruchus analis]
MQNAGQQYGGPGGNGSTSLQQHPQQQPTAAAAQYNQQDQGSNAGSVTTSLRQFRKEKQALQDGNTSVINENQHVARVAPHNHYPSLPRPSDCYRFPAQYQDYNLSPLDQSTGKPRSEAMCNAMPPQTYADLHMAPPSRAAYHQGAGQPGGGKREQDYHNSVVGGGGHGRRENDFLSKLQRIHPSMARSIMSDHHMQEAAQAGGGYRPPPGGVGGAGMDQNRMYATAQGQRYMNYGTPVGSPYGAGHPPHAFMSQTPGYPGSFHHPAAPPPASCSYARPSHHPLTPPTSRYPHHPEREGASNGLPYHHPHLAHQGQYPNPMQKGVGYPGAYPGQHPPSQEYAQHYQHRSREAYYQQHCRPSQYLPHQMAPPEIQESRIPVSNNLKQFLENWAEEEAVTEMQMETTEMCKDGGRVPREDQSAEIYMINASELQYFENSGIPLVTETGIPLQVTSENGQYIIKNGVALDNSGLRIFNKQSEIDLESGERVVNVHIMDTVKTDCMLAGTRNEPNQRKQEEFEENARVVIHQNTIIQSSYPNINQTDQTKIEEEITRSIIKECKKETVDKNCSPINLVELEGYKDEPVIYPTKVLEDELDSKMSDSDSRLKNMPTIEEFDEVNKTAQEEDEVKSDKPIKDETTAIEMLADAMGDVSTVKIEDVDECDKKSDNSTGSNESAPDAMEADGAMIIENDNPLYNHEIATDNHDGIYKRTKRIFSVDDIINNIGNQFNKTKEQKISDHKNYIEATREFLVQENKNVFKTKRAVDEVGDKVLKKNEVEELKEKILAEIEDTEISHSELLVDGETDMVDKTENSDENSDRRIDNEEKTVDQQDKLYEENKVNTQNISISESAVKLENDKEAPLREPKKVPEGNDKDKIIEKTKTPEEVPVSDTTSDKNGGLSENVHSSDDVDTEKQAMNVELPQGQAIVDGVAERGSDVTDIGNPKTGSKDDELDHIVTAEKSQEKVVDNGVLNPNPSIAGANETDEMNETDMDTLSLTEDTDCGKKDTSDTEPVSKVNKHEEGSEPVKDQDLTSEESTCPKIAATVEVQDTEPLEKETIVEVKSVEPMEPCEEIQPRSEVNKPAETNEKCDISIDKTVDEGNQSVVKVTETSESDDKEEKTSASIESSDHLAESRKNVMSKPIEEPKKSNHDSIEDTAKSKKLDDLERKTTNEEGINDDEIKEEEAFINSEDINEAVTDPLDCNAASEEIPDIKSSPCDAKGVHTVSEDIASDETAKEPPEVPDQEVQYRNVIRVEDNSILLHIAGELVEINVNTVNGKKVITVVPLSSSTVVDFNDNYDTVDNISACDPLKIDELSSESHDVEGRVGVPEFVEPSSEIIIGMDLNLEEEVELDLEQPKPTICTKAAKKAYDCDLQIPSITTSEDVYEKSNARSERNNDKVSSSKEKQDKSKRKHSKSSKDTATKSTHEVPCKIKSRKKSASKSDEEFVPFADLVKARKLKKLKLKQLKDKCKADSTNKLDEVKEVKNDRVPPIPTIDEESVPSISSVEEKKRYTKTDKRNHTVKNDVPDTKITKSPLADKTCVQEKNESDPLSEISSANVKTKEKTPPKSETKRKLSLEEYNNRKRKLMAEKELAAKKAHLEQVIEQKLTNKTSDRNILVLPKRSMSVDEPKPVSNQTKRSNSLEEISKSAEIPWNEKNDSRSNSNKTTTQDEILRNYKEQVESKLNSLNLQIPKVSKPKPPPPNIIQRFLKNDTLTKAEVEKIKEIILCKKLMQLKSPETMPGSSNYEVRKEEETDIKLHLKKLPPKKKKLRFRNLYADSSESDDDFKSANVATTSAVAQVGGDYAVVQSNRTLAGVVPKLIIKRKTEVPLPVVRLERLDLGIFIDKKRKYE